ncbi:LysR family transcriptional regulator [Noviherbaspirillum saxi]|uniref:LysR family transcriptional regulator n=1 Tax=Noviherbaspirillum saxi TaxID=2320863 RepID=A0A3A3FMD5_9BURK|nr:LysR family transcriptional regulator [Noviherbaspirillum saxi]RJF95891.1 LysR family transcriptional regulator [Noviherbaspirillum saxi]
MHSLQTPRLGKIKGRAGVKPKGSSVKPDEDTSSPITFRHWKVFHAVHDCGSFSDAAAFLHLSQPTICYTIARLEEHLGISLYYVDGRKVVITDAGKALLDRSRNLLKGAIALEDYARDLNDHTTVRLLCFVENLFPVSAIEPMIKQFSAAEVIVDAIGSKSLQRALNSKFPCFAVSSRVLEGCVGEPLVELEYVPVVCATHRLANATDLTSDILKDLPEVMLSDQAQSGWARPDMRGLRRSNPFVVSNIDTALEVLSASTAYAWLPQRLLPVVAHQAGTLYRALHGVGMFKRQFYVIRKIDLSQRELFVQFATMLKASIAAIG